MVGVYEQAILNGLVLGCLYALTAVSFNLIYGTCRFFHFAHSSVIAVGAYASNALIAGEFAPMLACSLGVCFAGVTGLAMYGVAYAPLRRRGARTTELLVASLGLMVVMQTCISLIFGDDAKVLTIGTGNSVQVGGAHLAWTQCAILVTSLLFVIATAAFVRFGKTGVWIRAVGDKIELARAVGLPVEKVIGWSFAFGSVLAGVVGLLVAYDSSLTPDMGLRIFLLGVTASIIGGIGTFGGALLGGILVGLIQSVGALWIPTQWQDASIFGLLIAFLLIRPQGFLGRPALSKAA
jgi:branched-chain amino acid transport system permease protein